MTEKFIRSFRRVGERASRLAQIWRIWIARRGGYRVSIAAALTLVVPRVLPLPYHVPRGRRAEIAETFNFSL